MKKRVRKNRIDARRMRASGIDVTPKEGGQFVLKVYGTRNNVSCTYSITMEDWLAPHMVRKLATIPKRRLAAAQSLQADFARAMAEAQ